MSYDELTSDTVANRGIYQAALRLTYLVEDDQLSSQLQRQHQQLRTWVSTDPVTPVELARVETSRLNEHYETILRLAEHVLRNSYLDSFVPTEQTSFGLLVNMNTIFENAIERAAQDALRESEEWTATPQSRIEPIATGGDPPVNMYPDVVLKRDDEVELVADAKWKTGIISQSDIYQMTSYMLAHDVPGILCTHSKAASWKLATASIIAKIYWFVRLPLGGIQLHSRFPKRSSMTFELRCPK